MTTKTEAPKRRKYDGQCPGLNCATCYLNTGQVSCQFNKEKPS